ncbi:serine O-acetyltransferase ['Osedax' symbiont bacterium Rs2_46_30_T18]|nr:serine O-acetyltransferase ['Osedax' symbiont bacterium Rs2_46_30_T18]
MGNFEATPEQLWLYIQEEARAEMSAEPLLASFYHSSIINHSTIKSALSFLLAMKLSDDVMSPVLLREILEQAMRADPSMLEAACKDVLAVRNRDPAADRSINVLLYLKGFQALQAHRVAHWMWQNDRRSMALYIQHRVSSVFQVDIHPAAKIGCGVMFDHATGIVIGETCVIENDVSILQGVTLGGTGNESGDRHPKVREGVMIGAGAKIFGNLEIGRCSKVGGGSVVVNDVPECKTVVGVPAKVVGDSGCAKPALNMDQQL